MYFRSYPGCRDTAPDINGLQIDQKPTPSFIQATIANHECLTTSHLEPNIRMNQQPCIKHSAGAGTGREFQSEMWVLRWAVTLRLNHQPAFYLSFTDFCKKPFFLVFPNLVPRVFHLPTPKGAREERPWFRLVTCLGNKFIFEGGVPIHQSIVAAAVCYLLNRLSGQPWKALFRFRSEDLSYQVHCFQHLKLNWVWELWKDKNVKL